MLRVCAGQLPFNMGPKFEMRPRKLAFAANLPIAVIGLNGSGLPINLFAVPIGAAPHAITIKI